VGIVTNPTLTGNVTVTGNLEVQGTTTTVDSTTVELGDNILALNGTGAALGGIHVNDGPASGSLLWDGTNNYWIAGASGSEVQVALLEGQGLLSGSAQIAANISGSITATSASLATDIATNKASIDALDDTYATDAQLNAVSASVKTFATNADTTLSASLATDIATNKADIAALDDTYATDAQLNAVSASVKTFATDADTTLSASIATDIAGNDTDIAALQTDSGSFSTRIATIESDNATQTELDAVSSSIASTITGLSSTLSISGSTGNDTVNLVDDDLSIVGTANAITTTVTNNQIAIDIVDNPTLTGNVTVTGNLEVQGTTTTVDSTTIELGDNILALNGTGAALGGIHVNDGPASGSLLWDGTNNYWIAGASGSEVQVALLSGQGLLSSSAQIAANISGSSTALSASIASDIAGLGSTYATDAELNASSSALTTAYTAADTTLSSSVAADIATNLASINALDDTYATDAEVNAATSSLSASLATDIATNLASIGTLNGKTLISGSTFSSPNQGTVRATINGANTDVDTGLQAGDSPTFAGLTVTGNLVVTGDRVEQQVTNLAVEDQFITINSGAAAQDAGFFFEGQGASFGWDESENRFALDFTGGTADQTTITSDAYVAAVAIDESDVNYQKDGNIFVSASGEAYIYVS
jgi:hypothetical protein